MELNDILESSGRILLFSHVDLDGAASAALFRAAIDLGGRIDRKGAKGRRWARRRTRGTDARRVVPRQINYGPMEAKAREYIAKWHSRFAYVAFTDFAPSEETCRLMDSFGIKYLVIDHHRTAYVQKDNPNALYCIDYERCGAMGVYYLFSARLDPYGHRDLAVLADDYDMWRHRNFTSRELNVAYWGRFGFNSFIRYFSRGFHGIGYRTMREVVKPHFRAVDAVYESMVKVPIRGGGVYVELPGGSSYMSDISLRLERQYPWFVFGSHTETGTKLSFRAALPVNLGRAIQELEMGGGHPKAAGQGLPPEADYMGFIDKVYDRLVHNHPGIMPEN